MPDHIHMLVSITPRMLTFLPLEQIDEMDKWGRSQLKSQAKEIWHTS